MDKFEKLIKDSIEGHEMPFDPQAWESVSNELGDSFDHLMKDSTNSYEAPYNPAAWDAVNHQLGPANSAWKWIGGSAAVIAIVAGGAYLVDSQSDDDQLTNHTSTEVVINDNNNVEDTYFMDEENTDEIVSNNNDNVVENNENDMVLHEIDPDLNNNVDPNQNDVDQSNNHNIDIAIDVEDPGNTDQTVDNNNENSDNTDNSNNSSDNTDAYNEDYKVNAEFNMLSKNNEYKTEVCQGVNCTFKPVDVDNELKYTWSFGDGGISASQTGSHKFAKAGEYTVTLTVTNPKNTKVLGTHTETIVVNPLPTANFSWDQAYAGIPTVKFANESFNDQVVNWNVVGLKQSSNSEFEYTFRKKGNYQVKLATRNDYGCIGYKSQIINIEEDYNLLAPTSFTPDGDGRNDGFIPPALTVMNVNFTMTVYDKSGKQVYRTQNAYEPWDGRFTEDNILAPSGSAYVWRVVLTNANGEQEMYEGQVFVIR